jgi:hypothetical protein
MERTAPAGERGKRSFAAPFFCKATAGANEKKHRDDLCQSFGVIVNGTHLMFRHSNA